MTNAEINLALATKLYNANMLKGASDDFIASILDYDKKDLKRLSHKQYKWLNDLANEASDYNFENRSELLVLKHPARVPAICIDQENPSQFDGTETVQLALENGSTADEAALAYGCNCKFSNGSISCYYKI